MYHEETLDAMRAEQREADEFRAKTDDLRATLMVKGKRLGVSERTTIWYVLDGKLYCDLSHTQLH